MLGAGGPPATVHELLPLRRRRQRLLQCLRIGLGHANNRYLLIISTTLALPHCPQVQKGLVGDPVGHTLSAVSLSSHTGSFNIHNSQVEKGLVGDPVERAAVEATGWSCKQVRGGSVNAMFRISNLCSIAWLQCWHGMAGHRQASGRQMP